MTEAMIIMRCTCDFDAVVDAIHFCRYSALVSRGTSSTSCLISQQGLPLALTTGHAERCSPHCGHSTTIPFFSCALGTLQIHVDP